MSGFAVYRVRSVDIMDNCLFYYGHHDVEVNRYGARS